MKQEQKVEIILEAKGSASDSPIKHKTREQPTTKFTLTPKCMPQLTKYIKEMDWNSVRKVLTIMTQETPDFEIYEWLQYINRRHKEVQEGPFVNLNEDTIDLKLLGENGEEFAIFRFKNISLDDHYCSLYDESVFDDKRLNHHIALSYQEVQKVQLDEKDVPAATNEVVDEEWQTIET